MVGKQVSGDSTKDRSKLNQKWMEEFAGDFDEGDESLEAEEVGGDFAELFEESQKEGEMQEGEVVEGTVVNIGPDYVTVDLGLKCEGLVPLHEFKDATGVAQV